MIVLNFWHPNGLYDKFEKGIKDKNLEKTLPKAFLRLGFQVTKLPRFLLHRLNSFGFNYQSM